MLVIPDDGESPQLEVVPPVGVETAVLTPGDWFLYLLSYLQYTKHTTGCQSQVSASRIVKRALVYIGESQKYEEEGNHIH